MIADMDINAFQVAASSSLGLSEVGIMQALGTRTTSRRCSSTGSGGS